MAKTQEEIKVASIICSDIENRNCSICPYNECKSKSGVSCDMVLLRDRMEMLRNRVIIV